MDRMSLLESGFLMLEAPETPMHVGGVSLFKFPDRVNRRTFMARLADSYRSTTELRKPFAHHVSHSMLGRFGPLVWEEDDEIDRLRRADGSPRLG